MYRTLDTHSIRRVGTIYTKSYEAQTQTHQIRHGYIDTNNNIRK